MQEKNGRLDIKILHAEGFPSPSEGKLPDITARLRISKPYPTPEHDVPKTKVVKGTNTPEFNELFQLNVKHSEAAQLEVLFWSRSLPFVTVLICFTTLRHFQAVLTIQAILMDISPRTDKGKEIFLGDVLVNIGKLVPYAGETIKWPFEIRKVNKASPATVIALFAKSSRASNHHPSRLRLCPSKLLSLPSAQYWLIVRGAENTAGRRAGQWQTLCPAH
eukprot:3883039-Rhodomonas_salina.1